MGKKQTSGFFHFVGDGSDSGWPHTLVDDQWLFTGVKLLTGIIKKQKQSNCAIIWLTLCFINVWKYSAPNDLITILEGGYLKA